MSDSSTGFLSRFASSTKQITSWIFADSSPDIGGSESSTVIRHDIKCYITDIAIECTSEDSKGQSGVVNINIQAFRPDKDSTGVTVALLLEKASSRQWKCNCAIELRDDLVFIVKWDESRDFGTIRLVKPDLREFIGTGSHKRMDQEFKTRTKGPALKLIYEMCFYSLDKNIDKEFGNSLVEIPKSLLDREVHLGSSSGSLKQRLLDLGDQLWKYSRSTLSSYLISDSTIQDAMFAIIRYQMGGNLLVSDIEAAISKLETLIDGMADDHDNLPEMLSLLGRSYLARFNHTEDLDDVSKAILSNQKVVHLTSEVHAYMPMLLVSLGESYQARFKCTRDISDLSEAISFRENALHLMPRGHKNLPGLLDDLGLLYHDFFIRTENLADISEAISCNQKAVHLTQQDDAYMPSLLNNLGGYYRARFQRTGGHADILEALSSQQNAVRLTWERHPNMPPMLHQLGILYYTSFTHTGELTDITEAISSCKKAIHLAPKGHPDTPGWLGRLGSLYKTRFELTGDFMDISEAISFHQKAVHLTPEGHADMADWLNDLGLSHHVRFERAGALADISEAISSLQKAVQLIPEEHPDRHVWLGNLGNSYQARFGCTRNLVDISEAISNHQRSVQLTPEGHTDMPMWLSNLGNSYQLLFKSTGDFSDISRAISSQEKAISLTPEGHAELPLWVSNLGNSYQALFERTGDLGDFLKAISHQRKAVDITPKGNPFMPGRLRSLGSSYQTRFEHTGDLNDIYTAMYNYSLAATHSSGSPSVKLDAARIWAQICGRFFLPLSVDAYSTAINLASQATGLEQTIQTRYTTLPNISDLSTSAVVTAIEIGRLDLAVEWLEQGRCLVWSQLNNLRTPLDILRAEDSALADDLMRVSTALDTAAARAEAAASPNDASMTQKMSVQDQTNTHIKLAKEWDELLEKIRNIPNFQDFLRPPSCSNLLSNICKSGPAVFINVHKERCDALALVSGNDQPVHITLPDFSYAKADNLRNQLLAHLRFRGVRMRESQDNSRGICFKSKIGMKYILRQLWILVVKPILDALGYSELPSSLKRIWWCATGPLAFLPIHAAGIYDESQTGKMASQALHRHLSKRLMASGAKLRLTAV